MTIYDEMQKISSDLLTEFKQGTISLLQITPGVGPVDNPGPSTETIVPIPGGVVRGVSYKYVKDGLAVSTDKTVVLPVVEGVTPSMRDFIIIDGVKHKIVQDISVPAAGTKVVWKFIVRKGS